MTSSRLAILCALLLLGAGLSPQAHAVCHPYPECVETNTPPEVSMTSPANGATATAPASFTLSAGASDPDGSVAAVEFFKNNVSVGVDSTAPYSVSVSGLTAGTYTFKAKATDDLGASTTSSVVTVTVNPPPNVPPTVSMTSPANYANASAPGSFVLTASASDLDGNIASVQFKNGAANIGSPDTAYPYSMNWSGVAAGNYSLTAVATDNSGASTTSSAINVIVNAVGNTPPAVSLTSPGSGASVQTGYAFSLGATANDSDGNVATVKYLSNGSLVATVSAAPWTTTYVPSSAGSYTLQAVATDNAGASTNSGTVNVNVSSPGSVSEARLYVYDDRHRLCKTINPESKSTVVDYDAVGNIIWTADGLDLPDPTNCNRTNVLESAKSLRTYDELDRVLTVTTPGGSANVTTEYFADGAVKKLTAANPGGFDVITEYTYNKRRLLTSELQTNGVPAFPISYTYDPNGHLATIQYPDNEIVNYNPDALGRPTSVVGTSATYASGISYYPNGAMSGFKYGTSAGAGPTHAMTQNARQLPEHSTDYKGTTAILDDTYHYDANGNVLDIFDAAQTGSASQTRGMAYDGLDRLITAVGPWGNANYTYDALDNLHSADQGARKFRYVYDSTTWRLTSIKDTLGNALYTFSYDANGNVLGKNSQAFVFDPANRMSSAGTISGTSGVQTYRYDGLGRRVQTTDPGGGSNPPKSYYVYTQAGQILYATEARNSLSRSYIYLNGSQIAQRTKAFTTGTVAVRYQMTDALGSPVASTNTSGGTIQRTSYTPWGEASPTVDGTGYTGHVMDGNTGLTYMQARYYDPVMGRFWSLDPAESEFNRYSYGGNQPYEYFDPDGRTTASFKNCPDMLNCGGSSSNGGADSGGLDPFETGEQEKHDFGKAAHAVGVAKPIVAAGVDAVDEQLSSPSNLAMLPVGGVGAKVEVKAAEELGVVYLRRNPKTLELYVGKAKNFARYLARQGEHNLKEGIKHEYQVLARAKANALRYTEELKLRENGGLSRLANKISAMADKKFREFQELLDKIGNE